MINRGKHRSWISRIRRAEPKALAFGVVVAFALLASASVHAQTFTVLYSFMGPPDGSSPYAGLLLDSAGNLYGTTEEGGTTTPGCSNGCGTVFKLDAMGNETLLYSFLGGTDGQYPMAGVIRDSAGNLYGTTSRGGTSLYGTIFKISGSQETVLHSFIGIDGAFPDSRLIRDSAGTLYGTAYLGGSGTGAGTCVFGCGTVFKLDKAGKVTVFSFSGYPKDGQYPTAGVIPGPAGGYGTTSGGGTSNYGNVFKISTRGRETVLHNFSWLDGANPLAGVIQDAAGNLYGTTQVGGAFGYGTVFKINTSGQETVLYSFTLDADGASPTGGLVLGKDGNLYGTTQSGGTSERGTVFKVSMDGQETVLHSFDGNDGAYPSGDLIEDAAGNLYGTTTAGGTGCAEGCGVVFKLTP